MEDYMAKTLLKGSPVNTSGDLPKKGSKAPEFSITTKDLSDVVLSSFKGKKVILNIFPSIDTSTCAMSVRKFNAEATNLQDTVVLCLSMDLPFAQSRFCGAEGLTNVITGSAFRSDFPEKYGVRFTDGPLRGLTARSVVVIDREGTVAYTELVPETTQEPNYGAALEAVKGL
jgi:thioredoxin-dependent peroxiredoxin